MIFHFEEMNSSFPILTPLKTAGLGLSLFDKNVTILVTECIIYGADNRESGLLKQLVL